jgi:hypothetical protein
VLPQVQDGQERVIAYDSKTLNKAERNYCVTWREVLAIMRTLEYFRKNLYGQEFHLCTNHSALTWLMSFKYLEGQTAHWIQHLKSTILLSSTIRAENMTMLMPFHDDHAEGSVPTATKLRRGQTSNRYKLLQL